MLFLPIPNTALLIFLLPLMLLLILLCWILAIPRRPHTNTCRAESLVLPSSCSTLTPSVSSSSLVALNISVLVILRFVPHAQPSSLKSRLIHPTRYSTCISDRHLTLQFQNSAPRPLAYTCPSPVFPVSVKDNSMLPTVKGKVLTWALTLDFFTPSYSIHWQELPALWSKYNQ